MAGRRNLSVLLIVSCLSILTPVDGKLFGSVQPDRLTTAVQFFNEGKFDAALPVFSKLCRDLPYDYLIKYYYGACLTETGNFGPETEKNLILASSGEVPAKVNYYLGRMYHGRSDWNTAQRFYNRFRNNATAGEIAAAKVEELIKLCYREINPFNTEKADSLMIAGNPDVSATKNNTLPPEVQQSVEPANKPVVSGTEKLSDKPLPQLADTVRHDTVKVQSLIPEVMVTREAGKENPVPESIKTNIQPKTPEPVRYIDFQINDKVTYLVEDMFHVEEAKNEFRISENLKTRLDSQLEVVQQLRKQYHLLVNPVVKDSVAGRIQKLEYENLVLKQEVDQHYFQSRKLEQDWWNKADYSSLEVFTNQRDSVIKRRNTPTIPEIIPVVLPVRDTVKVEESIDSAAVTPEIKADSGLVYKIQIGAYNKGIPTQRKQQFQRLEKIRVIESLSVEEGVTVYTTGNLRNFDDALKLQSQIRLEGIKDAFVIAVRNGKKVTLPVENTLK